MRGIWNRIEESESEKEERIRRAFADLLDEPDLPLTEVFA